MFSPFSFYYLYVTSIITLYILIITTPYMPMLPMLYMDVCIFDYTYTYIVQFHILST